MLRKDLGHGQNSVFYGALKMAELTKLRKEINKSLVEGDKLTELIVPNRHNVEIAEYSKGNRVSGLPSRTSDETHTRDAVVVEVIEFGRHCCGDTWAALDVLRHRECDVDMLPHRRRLEVLKEKGTRRSE